MAVCLGGVGRDVVLHGGEVERSVFHAGDAVVRDGVGDMGNALLVVGEEGEVRYVDHGSDGMPCGGWGVDRCTRGDVVAGNELWHGVVLGDAGHEQFGGKRELRGFWLVRDSLGGGGGGYRRRAMDWMAAPAFGACVDWKF